MRDVQVQVLLSQGAQLVALGQFDRAAELARGVLAAEPDCLQAWVLLADALLSLGDLVAAREAAHRACALGPEDAGAHLVATETLLAGGRAHAGAALRQAATAVRLAPHRVEPLWALCRAHMRLSHRQDAYACLRSLQEMAAGDPLRAHRMMAEVALWDDQNNLAAAHFERCLVLAPDDSEILGRLALARAGQTEPADKLRLSSGRSATQLLLAGLGIDPANPLFRQWLQGLTVTRISGLAGAISVFYLALAWAGEALAGLLNPGRDHVVVAIDVAAAAAVAALVRWRLYRDLPAGPALVAAEVYRLGPRWPILAPVVVTSMVGPSHYVAVSDWALCCAGALVLPRWAVTWLPPQRQVALRRAAAGVALIVSVGWGPAIAGELLARNPGRLWVGLALGVAVAFAVHAALACVDRWPWHLRQHRYEAEGRPVGWVWRLVLYGPLGLGARIAGLALAVPAAVLMVPFVVWARLGRIPTEAGAQQRMARRLVVVPFALAGLVAGAGLAAAGDLKWALIALVIGVGIGLRIALEMPTRMVPAWMWTGLDAPSGFRRGSRLLRRAPRPAQSRSISPIRHGRRNGKR